RPVLYTLSLHDALPICFKLLLNEEEVSMKAMGKNIKNSLSSFVRDVNHHLMGDFVSMPHEEIRRFKVRPLDKNDFGYLIKHLHRSEEHTSELQSRFDLV